jgi:hypothetical protein
MVVAIAAGKTQPQTRQNLSREQPDGSTIIMIILSAVAGLIAGSLNDRVGVVHAKLYQDIIRSHGAVFVHLDCLRPHATQAW